MKPGQPSQHYIGIISTTGAYFLWGFLPIYWKLLDSVPSLQVLAHRVVWSFIFMLLVLLVAGKLKLFRAELAQTFSSPRQLVILFLASLAVSINWLTFIWAVANDRIIETSLGYYINPLVSVLLGMLVLKEKLSPWQTLSFFLALIGVLNMTLSFGSFPWIALLLAVSFGFYGLLKKLINLTAAAGITAETLMITPMALIYLTYTHKLGYGAFSFGSPGLSFFLAGSGVITAIPLLLFSAGAKRLPLSAVGFLQYIAPSIALILGIYLYHEPFTTVHLISFALIWTALAIYSLSRTRTFIQLESLLLKKLPIKSPGA